MRNDPKIIHLIMLIFRYKYVKKCKVISILRVYNEINLIIKNGVN